MSKLSESLEKIPYSLVLVGYLGYLGYGYYDFTSADSSPLIQKTKQIELIKKDTTLLAAKKREREEFLKSLDSKRSQLREMAGKLDEMKSTLSEDLDVAEFIRMVITEAKKVGLTVKSIKPKGQTSKEFYSEHVFDLSYRGAYVQLIVFLERLSNVQRIVLIDNFSMKPISKDTSRYIELDGSIELKTYRYLASKADQVTKGGSQPQATPPTGKKVP